MKFLLVITLFILSNNAFILEQSKPPLWRSDCSDLDGISALLFSSKSGDVYEDDMTVQIQWSDNSYSSLPLSERWFISREKFKNTKCKGIGTFSIGKNLILLFLPSDGRPLWDQYSLVLINPQSKKILDIKEDVSYVTDDYKIIFKDNSLSVLSHYKEIKSDNGGQSTLKRWYKITISNSKIYSEWLN